MIWHRIGKGTYTWKSTGDFYEGDFADDTRTGFGTLTVKTSDGKLQRQYAGGWKNNMKHVLKSKRKYLEYIIYYYTIGIWKLVLFG